MSTHIDCGSCMNGDHSQHDGKHYGLPGLIGGRICVCKGDCAERYERSFSRYLPSKKPKTQTRLVNYWEFGIFCDPDSTGPCAVHPLIRRKQEEAQETLDWFESTCTSHLSCRPHRMVQRAVTNWEPTGDEE